MKILNKEKIIKEEELKLLKMNWKQNNSNNLIYKEINMKNLKKKNMKVKNTKKIQKNNKLIIFINNQKKMMKMIGIIQNKKNSKIRMRFLIR